MGESMIEAEILSITDKIAVLETKATMRGHGGLGITIPRKVREKLAINTETKLIVIIHAEAEQK